MADDTGHELSYVTLTGALRKEKNDELYLIRLPEGFHDGLVDYILKKRDEIKNASKPTKPSRARFGLRVTEEHERELDNAKLIVNKIFDIRARKIVLMALDRDASMVDTENMTPPEKQLFKKVHEAISLGRDVLVFEPFSKKVSTRQKSQSVKRSEKIVRIRMLSDIPAFVGLDGASHGPYKNGDVAQLPGMNARILVDNKKAKIVVTTPPATTNTKVTTKKE